MTIISIEKLAPGWHMAQSQSHRTEVWLDGYIEVPEALSDLAFSTGGYCDLVIENGVLTDIIPMPRPAPTLTPAEQRKQAYETEPLIEWDGDTITVDAANQLWLGYAAEESPKAETLQTLIIAAKFAVREMYPDET